MWTVVVRYGSATGSSLLVRAAFYRRGFLWVSLQALTVRQLGLSPMRCSHASITFVSSTMVWATLCRTSCPSRRGVASGPTPVAAAYRRRGTERTASGRELVAPDGVEWEHGQSTADCDDGGGGAIVDRAAAYRLGRRRGAFFYIDRHLSLDNLSARFIAGSCPVRDRHGPRSAHRWVARGDLGHVAALPRVRLEPSPILRRPAIPGDVGRFQPSNFRRGIWSLGTAFAALCTDFGASRARRFRAGDDIGVPDR